MMLILFIVRFLLYCRPYGCVLYGSMVLISDENGPYYWHIKSGTIQREAPIASPVDVHSAKDATSFNSVRVMKFLL